MSRALIIRTATLIFLALLTSRALSPAREHDDAPRSAGASTASGRAIPAERLGNSDYCGHCHTDIFHQWNASSHHFSSFNNPVYRRVALDTAQRRGPDSLEFCASCHDPLPLLAKQPIGEQLDSWAANAGITCLACHRITAIHGGNGQYQVSAPTLHPFALAEHPLQQKLHRLLLQLTPGLHRRVLSQPFYESPEYCASCHSLVLPAPVNGAQDLVLQDEHAQWHESHYAGDRDSPGGRKSCIDCHMPLVPSHDPAAKNGRIRSHRFTGGNTLLPSLNLDFDQLRATERFLQADVVRLQCSIAVRAGASDAVPCERAHLSPGERVELRIEISNRGAGHNFPAGTADSNEAWLSVTVTDASGTVLLSSGALDERQRIDPSSHFLRTQYVDRHGNAVDRRRATTEAATKVSDTTIPAGGADVARYEVNVPRQAVLPLVVTARLNWRKHAPELLEWVFSGRSVSPPPITTMAEVRSALGAPPR